ncbi:MAG TPA: hypothetical protein VEH78_04405 [Pseudolabrys sp.]|nr:hypothetical protein [Pseudolabrys sp.]
MAEPAPATSRGNYWCAALAAVTGIYFLTLGSGLLHIPGGRASLHGPQWLLLCVGLAFFLAGVAITVQTLGHANPATGALPAAAPRWMCAVQYLIGFAISACLGTIASWIAFGPGERHFSGTFLFFDPATNAIIGRAAFGFGAVIIWLCTAAVVASGIRTFFDDQGHPRAG